MCVGRFGRALLLALSLLHLSVQTAHGAPVSSLLLDNGMQVYLKPVESASATLDLRLILQFGAADEGPGEHGWAHLLEHMAFNGTRRFSAKRLGALFQQADLRPGRDINASTGSSHTVYKLTVPIDKPQLLEQNLQLIVDWLSAMKFKEQSLAREKRVIGAEALEVQHDLLSQQRWQHALFELPPAGKTVIGDLAEVNAASTAKLRQFWRRGYRPDNAILLITGDFDTALVTQKIRDSVGRLAASEQSTQRSPRAQIKFRDVALAQNQSLSNSRLALAKLATGDQQVHRATLAMLALQWKLQAARGAASCGHISRRVETLANAQELHYVTRSSSAAHELKCLAELSHAALKLRASGLDEQSSVELFHYAQITKQHLEAIEQSIKLSSLADQLETRLLNNASPKTEAERIGDLLEWMAVHNSATINRFMQEALDPEQLSLVVQTAGSSLPAAERVRALWEAPAPSLDKPAPELVYQLLEPMPVPAQHSARASETQWSLHYANGAQVHLLLTDNVRNHFDVLLVREGGLLSLPSTLVSAASQLPTVLPQMGLADSSAEQVQVGIREHKLSMSWFVENFRQGMRASASAKNAQALFSLLHHAQLPLPRSRFDLAQIAESISVRDQLDDGGRQLRRVIWRTLYDLGEMSLPTAPNVLDASSFHAARQRLFSGASDLQVYIAGDFDPQEMRHLADKYIGSLAASEDFSPLTGLYASAKRQRIVHPGNQSARADLFFYYVQSASNNLERFDAELLLLREVLAQRLWQVLREREGLGYGVGLKLQRRPYRRGGSSLRVSMVCDPDVADLVRRHVDEVFLSFLYEEMNDHELEPLRRRLLGDYKKLLKDNASLLDEWSNQRERGRSLRQVQDTVSEIEAIDAPQLQRYARQFFRDTGFLEVNVVPGLQTGESLERPAVYPVESYWSNPGG